MNLQTNLLDEYLDIRSKTYNIVENTLIEKIKASVPENFTLKDITVIYLIESKRLIKDNTSSSIAIAANMAFNAFSNRLKKLENNDMIERIKNPENKREHFIILTEEGLKIYHYYLTLLNDLFGFIFENLRASEKLKLLQSITKTADYFNETNKFNLLKRIFKTKKVLNQALTEIYDGIYLSEQGLLDKYLKEISLKEMRFLIEIYILSKNSLAIPKNLHETLNIPHSSITHTLNKCEQLKIIKKTQNPNDKRSYILSISKTATPIIEIFIKHRIDTYNRVKEIHTPKVWESTLKAFQLIEDFSIK